MNGALFRSMLKSHGKTIIGYSIASILYMCLVIWIYPKIADAGAINQLLKSLPEQLLQVFGMENGVNQVGDYIAGEYYGLLFLIILSIFCITTSTRLVARLVDQGSMANLLATPNSRTKVILTQASILITGIFTIVLLTTLGGLYGIQWISPDLALDENLFIQVNFVGFLLFFVVSGYCFLFSCLMNDERRALSLSTTITVLFFILHLAGKMSTEVDWLLRLSLFTAYGPTEIMEGGYALYPVSLGLLGAGILLYTLSILIFRKKDLPL